MKFCKCTEYFENYGLGLEFWASDYDDEYITRDEVNLLDLKSLDNWDDIYHQTIKLHCVYCYDEDCNVTILGYYE